MTEEKKPASAEFAQTAATPVTPSAPAPPSVERDWFLQMLVKMCNDSNLTMGLTVTVRGTTVTGTLISFEKYFREFGQNLASATRAPPADKSIIADTLAELGSPAAPHIDPNSPPHFIHLRDARITSPGGTVPVHTSEGVLWRGRISEVSGFFLGEVKTTS